MQIVDSSQSIGYCDVSPHLLGPQPSPRQPIRDQGATLKPLVQWVCTPSVEDRQPPSMPQGCLARSDASPAPITSETWCSFMAGYHQDVATVPSGIPETCHRRFHYSTGRAVTADRPARVCIGMSSHSGMTMKCFSIKTGAWCAQALAHLLHSCPAPQLGFVTSCCACIPYGRQRIH